MISDHDRRFYIGGSDASKLVMNKNTKTYEEWWLSKLGAVEIDHADTIYTATGTRFEHPILDKYAESLGIEINKDRQIIIEDKMLRINYDGDWDGTIFEVKTHKADAVKPFDAHSKYIENQCLLQMYVWQETMPEFKNLFVLEYPLYPEDYANESPTVDDIDFSRIKAHRIKYKRKKVDKLLEELEPLIPELKGAKERWQGGKSFGQSSQEVTFQNATSQDEQTT